MCVCVCERERERERQTVRRDISPRDSPSSFVPTCQTRVPKLIKPDTFVRTEEGSYIRLIDGCITQL